MTNAERRRVIQDFRRKWQEYRQAADTVARQENRKMEACETNGADTWTGTANIESHL